MERAYPQGIDSMPVAKRPYFQIDAQRPLSDYLPPTKMAVGVCQELSHNPGTARGYSFRLGSATYPHMKLRVQLMDFHGRAVRVYSVDTHDGFVQHNPEEAEAWRAMVEENRALKKEIESALEQAGFVTPKHLLELDLAKPT
jgi:hypothetical protein